MIALFNWNSGMISVVLCCFDDTLAAYCHIFSFAQTIHPLEYPPGQYFTDTAGNIVFLSVVGRNPIPANILSVFYCGSDSKEKSLSTKLSRHHRSLKKIVTSCDISRVPPQSLL